MDEKFALNQEAKRLSNKIKIKETEIKSLQKRLQFQTGQTQNASERLTAQTEELKHHVRSTSPSNISV